MTKSSAVSLTLVLFTAVSLRAQDRSSRTTAASHDSAAAHDSLRAFRSLVDAPPVVTHHTIHLANGQALSYLAAAGMLPIRNDTTGVTEGGMFYVAYTRDGEAPSKRAITFVFNGGPGSSSVWLHMGAFGPRKIRLNPDGSNPPPPYTVEDNVNTLLDQTDMVFIDPVGTGFSRAATPELGPKFWGLNEDVRAVGEFVRLYLTRFERWSSPRFVAGESYGTTRAAHLSGYLADRGIVLNGVILLSTVLNFGTLDVDAGGNDIGYITFLPSYTAAAWFHKKLPSDLQSQPLEQVQRAAERWAETDYAMALMKGNRLVGAERQNAVNQLARFTGTSPAFVEQNDLRIWLPRFNHELLRDRRLNIGRLDSRFASFEQDPGSAQGLFDPSEASIRNSFTPILSEYVRRELGYRDEDTYYILGGGIGRWHYPQSQGYANVVGSLEHAFAKNPYMKLYVAEGYYDMATPYWAVEYTLSHLNVDPRLREAITVQRFQAGHMMYIDEPSMRQLRAGLRTFIDGALQRTAVP